MPAICHAIAAQEEALLYHDFTRFGFFSILVQRSGRKHQHTFPLNKLLDVINSIDYDLDTWISQAEFKRYNRRLVNFARVGLSWVDLDYYNTQHIKSPPEKLAEQLLMYCSYEKLLPPSVIVNSGRGLQLKWLFDRPIPDRALMRWNALQKYLCENFTEYGADAGARDASRVLRLANTINSKSGVRCQVIHDSGVKYSFEQLCEAYLPYLREDYRELYKQPKQYAHPDKNKKTVAHAKIFTIRTLYWNRLLDLRKLVKLRGWEHGVPDGYQDLYLFYASCFLAWCVEPSTLFKEVITLAREFCPTWKNEDAIAVTQSVIAKANDALAGKQNEYVHKVRGRKRCDPRYSFRNQTMIELFKISSEEQRSLLTIIDSDEKSRRRKEARRKSGVIDRQSYLLNAEQRRVEAQLRRAKGESYRDIASALNCSAGEIHRLINGKNK